MERPNSQSGLSKSFVKERRHQIPGLRQTPYLKVLLVRCDDSDTYKAHTRRLVREWIKEHTPSPQSTTKLNASENHDAFEWLIVHIVVPNTLAATQPRSGGKSADGTSSSSTEKARWRGGGSSTILDKLRADFNSTSKNAIDRVAQVRIGINDVPYDILPRVVPAIPGSYTESPQEHEEAWADLISKFKLLILASFDMRVSQYEEDIREKDAQRSLPGWNFCTFFMFKEGLARGFESVGLVEDALVGYDELAVGLDGIIREQSFTGSDGDHSGSFLPYTKELKTLVDQARTSALKEAGQKTPDGEADGHIDSDDAADEADEIPLIATKKRYRDLILSSNISIFDFRCYLFARQLSLLLRLANASSSREELLARLKEQRESSLEGLATRYPASQPADDAENLAVLGQICKRTMDFIASIGRIMREDVSASYTTFQQKADGSKAKMDPVTVQVVDNIVSSFTFSVTQQILAQTATKALPIPPSTLAPAGSKNGRDGQEPKASIPEPKTMMHPARNSSLGLRSPAVESPSVEVFPGAQRPSAPERGTSTTFLKAGLEELAAHRAELYLISRSVLEKTGKDRGWSVGWAELEQFQYGKADDMEDVDIDEDTSQESNASDGHSKPAPTLHGINGRLLRVALDSQEDFLRLYETLTDKALRHYSVANHVQSVQSSMADLAVLKYHLEDYAGAAYFLHRHKMVSCDEGWTQIELSLLIMYAKCLKQLERKDEYVRVALKLLSRAADVEKERIARKSTFKLGGNSSLSHDEHLPDGSYLSELLEITSTLQREVQVPLQHFFGHVEVDGTAKYHSGEDSFALQVRLRYLLTEDMTIDKAKVKIAPVGESTREIWLETDGPVLFKKGIVKFVVQSNVSFFDFPSASITYSAQMIIPGTYLVNHVSLHAKNLVLNYDHGNTRAGKVDEFFKCPKLLIYHQAEGFDLTLFSSRYMHLSRNRALEIELSSGWNDVISGALHVRAATAGLRLQTSETSVVDGDFEISNKSEAGIIRFGAMASGSTSRIRMLFNLEHEVNDISVKLEVSYTTKNGDFVFAANPSVSVMLPLGVNVQDVFKHKALYSRFTISSATSRPLRLLSTKLENSDVFQAQSGGALTKPLIIFPRQPASILYRITRPSSKSLKSPPGSGKGLKSPLSLTVHYICVEEEIDNAVTLSLNKFFKETELYAYARLITHTVISVLRQQISDDNVEHIAVLSEIPMSILSPVKWHEHFAGLGYASQGKEEVATLIAEKLGTWQRENPKIALMSVSVDEATISASRSIIIPVEVPPVTVVHTADLKLIDVPSISGTIPIVSSTQPISASLVVKWTRLWDTQSPEPKPSEKSPDLEFVYEVSGLTDTWLIGGRRKGHFRVPTGHDRDQKQTLAFPVVMIPLREGVLPYPHVDIKPSPISRAVVNGEGRAQTKPAAVTCETDYKNAGESIRVISNTRKVTVSLDASGPQGGAMILEVERRTGGLNEVSLG